MSNRNDAALAAMDALLPAFSTLPDSADRATLLEEAQSLRRAIAAFHMEAIRFRMYSVDRLLTKIGADSAIVEAFETVRRALEAAGFHTRSHAAPH